MFMVHDHVNASEAEPRAVESGITPADFGTKAVGPQNGMKLLYGQAALTRKPICLRTISLIFAPSCLLCADCAQEERAFNEAALS